LATHFDHIFMIHTSGRLQNIREKLGLDQRSMALFLETSRQLISLIELQKRSEPQSIKTQLDQFEVLLFTKTALAKEKRFLESTDKKAMQVPIRKEITAIENKLSVAVRNLKKVELDYIKHVEAMLAIQSINKQTESAGKKPHPILKQQLNRLEEKLKGCNPSKQELLKARIEGMRSEITYLKKSMGL